MTEKNVIGEIAKDLIPKDGSFQVATLADDDLRCQVNSWIPSGCLPVDLALSLGYGWPVGRLVEVYGENSTGKTLLAVEAIVAAQAMGALCVLADVETAISKPLLETLGVDSDKLIYFNPSTIADVFSVLGKTMKSKEKRMSRETPMLFVWDSVASSTTEEEISTLEENLEKRYFSPAARQISAAFRGGLCGEFAHHNVCAMFINQTRTNVGVMFGDKVVTFGGKAIGFYSTMRVELNSKGLIKDTKRKLNKTVGVNLSMTVKKNKVAPPYQTAKFPVYFGEGIDNAEAIFDLASVLGVIRTSGSFRKIDLAGEEKTFRTSEWSSIYDENWEEIDSLVTETYLNQEVGNSSVESMKREDENNGEEEGSESD